MLTTTRRRQRRIYRRMIGILLVLALLLTTTATATAGHARGGPNQYRDCWLGSWTSRVRDCAEWCTRLIP